MGDEIGEILRELGVAKRGHNLIANFCGWSTLSKYVENCPSKELAGYAATSILTGGRISEVLSYKPSMIKFKTLESGVEVVRCEGLPVLKKRKSASPVKRIRTIAIPAREPLVDYMMRSVSAAYNEPRVFPWKDRTHVWRLVTKVDPGFWPHRFRTERASQLVAEYGFDVALLMKFFNWDKAEEAVGYVRLSAEDITSRMVKKSS